MTAAGEQEAHRQEASVEENHRRRLEKDVAIRVMAEATATPDYPESPQPPHSTDPLAQQARPVGLPRPNSLRKIPQAVPFYNRGILNIQPRPPAPIPTPLLNAFVIFFHLLDS